MAGAAAFAINTKYTGPLIIVWTKNITANP
jgi:hypothetical protein